MADHRTARRILPALGIALAGALAWWLPGLGDASSADDALVASSVCEAQELKAAKQKDPDLVIEIPDEYDKPFPSLNACRSHEAAWDEEAPGPMQPIPFSHQHHAGEYQIDCQYCHTGTDRSARLKFSSSPALVWVDPGSTPAAGAMAGSSSRSPFTVAAAAFISPSASMNSRGIRSPLIGKFSTARWVCAPQSASFGTLSFPMLSDSMRVSFEKFTEE